MRRLALGGAVFLAVVLLGTSLSAGAVARKHKPAQPLCTKVVSLSAIRAATGLPGTQLTPKASYGPNPVRWKKSQDIFWDFWVGRLPGKANLAGSSCTYDDLTPNTSYTQIQFGKLDVPIDYVVVGYGESQKYWNKFKAEFAKNGGDNMTGWDIPASGIHGHAPQTSLNLGHGSNAILNTVDLVAAGDDDPNKYPKFPTKYYIVTVMTRHHNVFQIGMYGASLSATTSVASSVLGSSF